MKSNKKKSAMTSEPAAPAAAGASDLRMERAQRLFARMPDLQSLHFTSDGLAFAEHQHARAHARNLSDDTIVTIERK
ncbi:MAG: hypothetical protein IPM52_13250 [Bacteroidetes bacterium]|nr:hypothetical protein [Bacteroidota bacterium]